MSIGILCFPAGWDNDHVRGICGASAADYVLGDCGIRYTIKFFQDYFKHFLNWRAIFRNYQKSSFYFRWAFVLAVVAVLDAWILGCLAFTLAHRHAKPLSSYGGNMHISESPYMNPGSIYKGRKFK